MYVAAWHLKSLSLSTWLLDEKGAGVNARSGDGRTSLHVAPSLDVLNAFLDRGGDPNLLHCRGVSALMQHTFFGQVRLVKRMLQDPRVRASVDVQMFVAAQLFILPAATGTKEQPPPLPVWRRPDNRQ